MRILAIRGENLASLSDRFEIDFESEPLRSAGLFAITGETGAGKSTILDALCLALYDKFPRVAAQSFKEEIPDSSGKNISANDPRSILRRGAGRGFAEADFIGRDGVRYRARWEIARARGRSTGNLQNRVRSLSRIDERGAIVAAVESGVELVANRIVELTDLTFEQFRRTVLLAQGDFDAFLRADSSERAELLEKITGAAHYAEISKQVYQRTREAESAITALEQRLADIGLLDDKTRAALAEEVQSIEDQRQIEARSRDAAMNDLHRHEAITKAETRLAQACEERDVSMVAADALEKERERLILLERLEPLRALSRDQGQSVIALRDACRSQEDAQSAAAAAVNIEESEREQERRAVSALELAESQFKQFTPIWSQAESLDSRIEVAGIECKKAKDFAATATTTSREKEAANTSLAQGLERVQKDLLSARETLARVAAQKPLHDQWPIIEGWLDKRREFTARLIASQERIDEFARNAAQREELLAALDSQDAKDRIARDRLAESIEQKSGALSVMNEAEMQSRAHELERLTNLLRELAAQARIYSEATHLLERATADLNAALLVQRAERETIAALREMRALDEARRDETERLGELADAAASENALRLRASLIEGEPCPVCGAQDHPHAHSSEAANEFVASLRARRDELRSSIASANKDLAETCEREAAARAQTEDARRRMGETDARRQRALHDYSRELDAWPQQAPAAPAVIDDADATLKDLAAQIGIEREAIACELDKVRVLRADIDAVRKSFDQRAKAIEARRAERERAEREHADAEIERTRVATKTDALRERLSSIDGSLAPFLSLCGFAPEDLDRDAAGAKAQLESKGAEFQAASRRAAELEGMHAKLTLESAKAATMAREAAAAAKTMQDAAAERARELASLQENRAPLLGGEATSVHRSRVNEQRRDAQQRLQTISAKRSAASVGRAAAQERAAAAALAAKRAQDAHDAAVLAYRSTLSRIDLDEALCRELLDVTPGEREEVRASIDAAQRRLELAQAAVRGRQRDLDELLRAGRPRQNSEELGLEAAQSEEALARLGERLGAVKERVAADLESRAKASALAVDFEAAKRTQRIWAEINVAVGSASGDKFRRFAQGVTLDHLIGLANRHLAALSSRYLLERAAGEGADLGLQIIDRDMAEERRSTRSLSGGERFLASLALALALCSLEGRDSFVDTLFIDEGFGTLDAATLDIAIDALETLQGQGRKVGLISHVESLHQRVPVQIRVERRGGGRSAVRINAPAFGALAI